MQYITQALRDAVARALEIDEQHQRAQHAARVASYEAELATWMAKHKERWAAASKIIAAACRKDKPITADMIPDASPGYNRLSTFDTAHPGEFVYRPDVELKTVANALDLVPDAKIGVRDLNALGVRGSALRFVLSLAPVRGGKNTAVTE